MAKKINPTEVLGEHNNIYGEIIKPDDLNILKIKVTDRAKGRKRVQSDYSNCISRTESHNAHANDLNFLVKKYTPDELQIYLAGRNASRRPIEGHDFTKEPNLAEARAEVTRLKREYAEMSPEYRKHFPDLLSFLKFMDNPLNAKKAEQLGLGKIYSKDGGSAEGKPSPVPPTGEIKPNT